MRRPHGIRGAVLIEPLSDVPERFAPGSVLDLVGADGRRQPVEVVHAAAHGDSLRVSFVGFDSRDDVEPLRGGTLEVSRERTPAAPDGEFYYFELAGCVCVDRVGGTLGTVSAVIEDGGGLLLEVVDGERTLPIPFVRAFIHSIDIPGRRIELELPEGLIETCAST